MISKLRLSLIGGLSLALVASLMFSCVTGGGGGGGLSGMVGGGGGGVVMRVNGKELTSEALLKDYTFRQALQQFVYTQGLLQRAAAEGVAVDESEIDKAIADQKAQIAEYGMKLEDVLKQRMMTEDDLREMIRMQNLNTKLVDKLAGDITEADIRAEFDKRGETLKLNYASVAMLTESQRKSLTIEDKAFQDYIRSEMKQERGGRMGEQIFIEALRKAKVEFPPLPSSEWDKWRNIIVTMSLPPEEDAQDASSESAAEDAPADASAGTEAPADAAAAESAGEASPDAGTAGDAGAGEGQSGDQGAGTAGN